MTFILSSLKLPRICQANTSFPASTNGTMASNAIPQSLKESIEKTKCDYRQLGNSGLRISVPVFGCMSFGDTKAQSWAIDEAEVRKFAWQNPVNHIRSANDFSKNRPCLYSRTPTTRA